jgi:hypothetical protein
MAALIRPIATVRGTEPAGARRRDSSDAPALSDLANDKAALSREMALQI